MGKLKDQPNLGMTTDLVFTLYYKTADNKNSSTELSVKHQLNFSKVLELVEEQAKHIEASGCRVIKKTVKKIETTTVYKWELT